MFQSQHKSSLWQASGRAWPAVVAALLAASVAWPTSARAQDTEPRADAAPESAPDSVSPVFKKSSEANGEGAEEPAGSEVLPPEDDDGLMSGVTVTLHPAYRVRSLSVNPLDLSSEHMRGISWTEQRFRLGAKLSKAKLGSINVQLDALDGVLFGDNGRFGSSPAANSGVSITAKRPNVVGWGVGLEDGADPLDPDSYVPVLQDRDPLEINYLYADIILPIGLLRIGRQPLNYGATISAHDGGPYNRWGVSQYSDGVDRILFGTKLDEAWRAINGGGGDPDLSMDNGVIWALFYDIMKQDVQPTLKGDLSQFGTSFQFLDRDANWGGLDWRHLKFAANAVFLGDPRFDTQAFGFPVVVHGELEDVELTLQYIHLRGQTREISEGFAVLSGQDPQVQQIRSHGAHAVLDWKLGPVVLTLQGDYASGDADPRPTNALTSFSFARDLNVGLLLFEHLLAFESARSVAVGVENLASSDLKSFPLTEVKTDGRFTNALAFFPQAYVDWIKTPEHRLHTRVGVLFAWPGTSGGVVDPIMTNLRYDGQNIADDAVNFSGGKPGDYYGTEVDLQMGYGFRDAAKFTVEGAMLFPGSSLEDANGDATNSYLVEARFEVAL